MKKQKMEFGYIDYKKKTLLLSMLGIILVGAAIFLLGLALNKGDLANIFSVVAVLFVIPAARFFTVWVVLAPYRSPDRKKYEEMRQAAEGHGLLISDMVFTSSERPMQLEYMVLAGSQAYCYKKPIETRNGNQPSREQIEKRKKLIKSTEEYLNQHFASEKVTCKAKIWEEETAFLKAVQSHTMSEDEMEIQEKVKKSMEYFMV